MNEFLSASWQKSSSKATFRSSKSLHGKVHLADLATIFCQQGCATLTLWEHRSRLRSVAKCSAVVKNAQEEQMIIPMKKLLAFINLHNMCTATTIFCGSAHAQNNTMLSFSLKQLSTSDICHEAYEMMTETPPYKMTTRGQCSTKMGGIFAMCFIV